MVRIVSRNTLTYVRVRANCVIRVENALSPKDINRERRSMRYRILMYVRYLAAIFECLLGCYLGRNMFCYDDIEYKFIKLFCNPNTKQTTQLNKKYVRIWWTSPSHDAFNFQIFMFYLQQSQIDKHVLMFAEAWSYFHQLLVP